MKLITGGDLVVKSLVKNGINYVFSIVGGQMGTIYDAIGETPQINIVTPRSETTCGIMACGYTASTGIPSVSMATVGAGVVYEVAGLSKAWFDYLPVISIAPQVQSWKMKPHQENLQACEQDELFLPVTKWNTIVYHFRRIPQMIDRGVREAVSGIPGPVHIDIPVDVLFKRKLISRKKEKYLLSMGHETRFSGPVEGDPREISEAKEALLQSKRPVIIIGQGTGRFGRYRNIKKIISGLGIPAITTTRSAGTLCGVDNGFAGHLSLFSDTKGGMEILKTADLILIVGIDADTEIILSRLNDLKVPKTIIHIETEPSARIETLWPYYPVYADPENGLTQLISEGSASVWSSWLSQMIRAGDDAGETLEMEIPPKIQSVFDEVKGVSTENHILITDGKIANLSAACYLKTAVYKDLFIMDERDMPGAGLHRDNKNIGKIRF